MNQREIAFLRAPDPEAMLMAHLAPAAMDAQAARGTPWRPGAPLSLLLAGYCGAGNLGADMRTGEIVRQIRHLLGTERVRFRALNFGAVLPGDVLPGVDAVSTDGYLPDVLAASVAASDAAIACEGSMFKSTFSDVLSATMAGALGLAARQGKPSVAYGAEIGVMDTPLERFVAEHVAHSLVLTRNAPSQRRAQALGLRAFEAADTAWSFAASPRDESAALLRDAGWNGSQPLLTVCPMNPFWWPVRPNPSLAAAGVCAELRYGSVFYHASSPEIDVKYRHYIKGLARAIETLCRRMDALPLLIGMERVDWRACRDLSAQLCSQPLVLMSCEHPAACMVGILRMSALLVSSRFHALVGAMPGQVPSIGIAMDERIRNLLDAPDQAGRVIPADAPDLAERVVAAAVQLDPVAIARSSARTVAAEIRKMGEGGIRFCDEIARVLPNFSMRHRPRHWEAHLPPLPSPLLELMAA
ncbi:MULTISPECIES: polysaccharide pyruvyl transferase family protein [unclassified Burkholderia]|uniref:polysaccharide pyruvyl transferase family protein n=1 Tax=unclassified Burkholderia TaxID=2613784 RepID=UPI000F58988B|nr:MULTISPECIES: polysaccharide pyruvyl transferase family protein [unclassified Burkholderia]RQR70571.1 hypothetical protein DIE11_31240 [Burkholderia sp. Bp9012]RQR77848.1 hypothetical protein DIE10_25095 [Burkholderia sp. Bp9011]RQR87844.1 hypothetical protein DIE09_27185 [Burkholderia sp. Bp9010]RQZ43784.1 hypothetical protein DIE17_26650 [Burkholderia sp. Bp9099]